MAQPSTTEVAEAAGLSTAPDRDFYDLIIVGGGPAGLCAAVYGASEGLRTLLVERQAVGGQAGQSSRIENYLGFPDGISGGDLCVQACANDPQVAVHVVRNLARLGMGVVSVRWSQLGFGRTSSTTQQQTTPRNLFGFKDGTANIKAEETKALDEHVWVSAEDDPQGAWLAGGSYLAVRRINMTIEVWDRQPLLDQEQFVGRTKGEGSPLSGGGEFTDPDFDPGMFDLTRAQLGPGYGHPTNAAARAAALASENGLALDPVYTAKAMAGLLAWRGEGRLGGPTLFVHTDGPR